jgi:hypothetical protein
LIQFAENRPVSHAAIFLGPENRRADFAHTTRHNQTQPAARKAGLRDRLRGNPGPYDRTVTAFRHVDVLSRDADSEGIIDRVNHYVNPATTKYAYLNLVVLMAPTLLRSYRQYLSGGRVPSRSLGYFLEKASNTLLGFFDVNQRDREFKLQQAKCTLTCSEFVYRCYAEGGLEIEVVDPLEKWKSRRAAEPRTAGLENVDGLDQVELHTGITSLLGQGAVRGGPRGPSPRTTTEDLATRTAKALGDLMSHNLNLSKYDGQTVRGRNLSSEIIDRNAVADLVTPRDLWSSPSLKVCSILHRPPDVNADSNLDAAH